MDEQKFFKQRGFWPFVTFWGGLYFPFHGLLTFYSVWHESQKVTLIERVYDLVPWLFFGVVLMVWGIGIAGTFPAIKLTEQGIQFQWLRVFHGTIKWVEISGILSNKKQRVYGVLISRPGFSLIRPKGLFFRALFGWLVERLAQPVMLLSENMDNFDEIIREIKAHVKPSLVTKRKI